MFHDYCLKCWDIGLICNRMAGLWYLGLIARAAQVGREIARGECTNIIINCISIISCVVKDLQIQFSKVCCCCRFNFQ